VARNRKTEASEIQHELSTAWEELTRAFNDVTASFSKSSAPSKDQISRFGVAVGHIREARRKRSMHWHEWNRAEQRDRWQNEDDRLPAKNQST
jgi:hypothetical protein